MKKIYNVINLLPIKTILDIDDNSNLSFGEGVYIQTHGHIDRADDLYVSALKQAILFHMKSKKDFHKKIYTVHGFEFSGI